MKALQLLLLAVAGGATLTAIAHTQLSESVPADQAMLESAPDAVQLDFSEPVRLTALAIQMDGAAQQDLGPLPTTASEHFSVAAPVLAKGHYRVSWRALSADSHVVSGEFMFVIGAAGGSANAGGNHDSHSAAH